MSILVTHGSLRGGAAGIAGERPTEVKEGPPRAVRPLPWAGVWLSAVALLGAAAASIATLAWDGAFPPPALGPPSNGILGEARGWSAVTLALAIPLGVRALLRAREARLRTVLTLAGARTRVVHVPARLSAVLTLAGVQAYLVYTYLEMAVSQPFTPLYLLYVATFATALPALVLAVGSVRIPDLPAAFTARAPRRTVAAFALLYSTVLSAAWLKDILGRSFAGQFGWRDAYGTVAHVVHALDLGLQVPLAVAAAILLWRRRPAGYLVGAICVVMAACMGTALAAMVAGSALISGTTLLAAVPFAGLGAVSAALALLFFRAMPDQAAAGT
ncbi:MAG TPA: hypothetical protein VFA20_18585 [Myxococcaceae bacterium]|nr:hypothetical protein [Myxococcaceae bacterium]